MRGGVASRTEKTNVAGGLCDLTPRRQRHISKIKKKKMMKEKEKGRISGQGGGVNTGLKFRKESRDSRKKRSMVEGGKKKPKKVRGRNNGSSPDITTERKGLEGLKNRSWARDR